MKFTSKDFWIVIFLVYQSFLFAHNPQQASLKLFVNHDTSFLEINSSQYGIEQALVKKYPELNLDSIPSKEFKELLIKYVKETIVLSVNDQQLRIGKGVIKLGSHQTDLKFKMNGFPKNPKSMMVDAHCFKENTEQNNFFSINYKGQIQRVKPVSYTHLTLPTTSRV